MLPLENLLHCWSRNYFYKYLVDICPFVGPLIHLLGTSGGISSGFQSQSGSLILTWWRYMWCMFSQIHLWCDTCWPLGGQHGGQHGGWAILIPILANKHWCGSRLGSIMPLPHNVRPGICSTDWAIPAQLVGPETYGIRSLQKLYVKVLATNQFFA